MALAGRRLRQRDGSVTGALEPGRLLYQAAVPPPPESGVAVTMAGVLASEFVSTAAGPGLPWHAFGMGGCHRTFVGRRLAGPEPTRLWSLSPGEVSQAVMSLSHYDE
jgi:hypothetical protein